MKTLVNETPVKSAMDLVAPIVASSTVINHTLGILVHFRRMLCRFCRVFIIDEGGCFEYPL